MGELIVIKGRPAPKNADIAQSMRKMADLIEEDSHEAASYGLVIAYRDGTIGIEYGGGMLTTLLGGVTCLGNRLEREL